MQIRVEGTVRAKDIKTVFQGSERKLNVSVSFDGGTIKTKFPAEEFERFPGLGQPVVLYLTGECVQTEYGVQIKSLQALKYEAGVAGMPRRQAA